MKASIMALGFLVLLSAPLSTLNGQGPTQVRIMPERFLGTWAEVDEQGKALALLSSIEPLSS
jgi:hypothetical protein